VRACSISQRSQEKEKETLTMAEHDFKHSDYQLQKYYNYQLRRAAVETRLVKFPKLEFGVWFLKQEIRVSPIFSEKIMRTT
jgi:hypothetical protein